MMGDDNMSKVIYCKFNQGRNEKYQTVTKIYKDNELRYIEKEALTDAAKVHLSDFEHKYQMTRTLYPNISFLPCKEENGKIRYDYVTGLSIDDYLYQECKSWDDFIQKVKEIFDKYYFVNDANKCDFQRTDEFIKLFGDIDLSGEKCIRPVNLDMIFDNIVLDEKLKAVAFDYEWVYDITVPETYVIYRVLSRMYDKFFAELSAKIDFEDFVELFHIDKSIQKTYQKMESSFIGRIYCDGETVVAEKNHVLPREDIRTIQNRLADAENRFRTAYREIDKLNVHCSNLEDAYKTTEKLWRDEKANLAIKNSEYEQLRTEYEQLWMEYENIKNEYQKTSAQYIQMTQQLNLMAMSKSWKLTKPLRLMKKTLRVLREEGIWTCYCKGKTKIKNKYWPEEIDSPYGHLTAPVVLKRQRKQRFEKEYKISVITPLFNTPENFLREMIESVQNQTYANWELCAVDFSSEENRQVEEICRLYMNSDKRIIYRRNPDNKGISENTNECLKLATGEYIAMLDHDDILHPSAFYEVMKVINEEGSDFIYSDEIKFESDLNHVYAPNFKSDFGADELRAHNYICHLTVYKKVLLDKVGKYRKECDGSQDHDMVLRLTEIAEHITHIPKILYYWRVHPNSVAIAIEAKPYATLAGIRAVEMQLKRQKQNYYAESVRNNIPCYRLKSAEPVERLVRVVVWGSSDIREVRKTIKSVKINFKKGYKLSIVTTNNETACLLDDSQQDIGWDAVYVQAERELNQKKVIQILNNHPEEYYLFIKAGISILTEDAMNEMLMFAIRENVAAVDTKILYSDGRLYSGGVVAGKALSPCVQFRCKGKTGEYGGFEDVMIHVRNVSAVSGLCTMISKKDWLQIPEGKTNNANSFISQSLHAGERKKELVWTPYVIAQGDLYEYDYYCSQQQYADEDVLEYDPFYNSNIQKYGLE